MLLLVLEIRVLESLGLDFLDCLSFYFSILLRISIFIFSLFQKNLFKKDSSFSFYDREKSLSSINILFLRGRIGGLSASVAHAPLIPLPSLKPSPSPPTTPLKVGELMVMDFLKKIKRGKEKLENPRPPSRFYSHRNKENIQSFKP